MSLWCTYMKIKEIIMWICVCPNWHRNFDSKKWLKEKPFSWNQSINVIYPIRRISLWFLIMKERRLLRECTFILIGSRTLILKMVGSDFFLKWNQSINSFFPMRRMSLWCLIMKRKEIIMWIHAYPNWRMNFNSKNSWKWIFFYETKASMSFLIMSGMSLWCPFMKRKEIIMWIYVCPN